MGVSDQTHKTCQWRTGFLGCVHLVTQRWGLPCQHKPFWPLNSPCLWPLGNHKVLPFAGAWVSWINCKRPVSGWRLETVLTTSPPTKSQQTDWQNQSNSQPKWTFQQPKNNRNKCQLDQEWQMTQLELPKWTKLWSQAPWRCGNCNGDNDTQSKWQTQDKQYTNRKNESEL